MWGTKENASVARLSKHCDWVMSQWWRWWLMKVKSRKLSGARYCRSWWPWWGAWISCCDLWSWQCIKQMNSMTKQKMGGTFWEEQNRKCLFIVQEYRNNDITSWKSWALRQTLKNEWYFWQINQNQKCMIYL